jgi:hypothetical protein
LESFKRSPIRECTRNRKKKSYFLVLSKFSPIYQSDA